MDIKFYKLIFLMLVIVHPQMNAQVRNEIGSSVDSLPEFDCIIEPGEIVDVGTAMLGVIEEVFVDIGDFVEKDMPLAKLDLSVERASLELARAKAGSTVNIELRKEQADFTDRSKERSDQLYAKSLISSQNIDQLVTEQRVAQLQLREANDQSAISKLDFLRISELLKRGTIRSPINGVVMERFKSAGEYVKDTPLMRIAQLNPLHVEIIVPVEYLGIITTGIEAKVTPSVFGYTSRRATVERIDRVADTASGTFGVRLNLPNPDHKIPGGLRCKMMFVDNSMVVEPVTQTAVEDTVEVNTHSINESNIVEHRLSTIPLLDAQKVVLDSKPDPSFDKINKMTLDDPGSQSRMPQSFLPAASMSSDNTPELQCYSVGPMAKKAVAKALSDDLRERVKSLSIREDKRFDIQDYLVLSKQQKDQTSLLNLKARYIKAGIKNIYVMGAGDTIFASRISLGAFRVRANADSHQGRLAKLGFDLDVVARQQPRSDFWLDLSLIASTENTNSVNEVVKHFSSKSVVSPIACDPNIAG
jgi:RND family efflux transporter MFP subunit